jgi:hypothetical protein
MPRPTPKQKRLIAELEDLHRLFALHHTAILEDHDPESWTPRLEIAKNQIIRSQVIIWYTLTDEFLNTRLAHFFFGKGRSFIDLWRTKKFQLFNYHVLEELSLMQKLRFAKAVSPIPKRIVGDIERLNALRNGVAHAFFPENLKKSKPIWKGKDIFSIDGIKLMSEDMQVVFDYFLPTTPHAYSLED